MQLLPAWKLQLPRIWSLPSFLCSLPISRCGWNLALQNLLLSLDSLEIYSPSATHSNLQSSTVSLESWTQYTHRKSLPHPHLLSPKCYSLRRGRVWACGAGGRGSSVRAIKQQQLLQCNRRSLPEKMMQTPRSYLQPNDLSRL